MTKTTPEQDRLSAFDIPAHPYKPFTYEQTRPACYVISNGLGQEYCRTQHPATAKSLTTLLNRTGIPLPKRTTPLPPNKQRTMTGELRTRTRH